MTRRLQRLGFTVTAADVDGGQFSAEAEHHVLDFDDPTWSQTLDGPFELITAIEIVEHLENPTAFLRSTASLLAPGGVALVTTPNVDSLPARIKFLLKGRLRAMDEWGDPTHITPLTWWTFTNRLVPRTGLELVERRGFPEGGFVHGNPAYQRATNFAGRFFRGGTLTGDIHVMTFRRSAQVSALS